MLALSSDAILIQQPILYGGVSVPALGSPKVTR